MCTNFGTTVKIDKAAAEAFGQTLLETLNKSAAAIMISIGHRTGLFDTMSTLPPADSRTIANRAQLNERYVREWLSTMVTSGIIEYDREAKLFSLPVEHAAFLTRAAGADNMSTIMQFIAEMGSVESRIVECFQNGGGVDYEDFPRFHEIMAEESGQSVLPALLEHIIPLAPGLEEKLTEGIDVLDLGCGSGRAIMMLAERFPNSRFFGYDLCVEPIAAAHTQAESMGLSNIEFVVRDATKIDDIERFDAIFTFDAIHDQADPKRVLENINRALKPDGVYIMQEIDGRSELGDNLEHPLAPLLYTISCMHCMTVSLAQGGAGLGTMWGVDLAESMLRDAGFTNIDIQRFEHDIQNAYFVIRKDLN